MSPWRTLQWRKPGALDARARQQQHVERQIDAEPALDMRAEHFQDAAGAGAEIEQRAERPIGQRVADGGLHRLVGDMQLADAVPLRGMGAEVILRGGGARRPHRGEPLAVAQRGRVGAVEAIDQRAGEFGGRRRARPAGRTPRRLRGSARPARPRPGA